MTATPSFLRPRTWLLAAASVAALGSIALQPALADNDDDDDDRIEPAHIATVPLYSKSETDRPAMVLAPSVEYPTMGAANRDEYSPDKDYVGYFNHSKCYEYVAGDGTEYFKISGSATDRKCSTDETSREFSGNFLNWATASSMDIMRLALTGGDRAVDTETTTILQRA